MAAWRSDYSPAMIASTLLHAGVFALALVSWPWTHDLAVGGSVPVNIVTNAPQTDLRPAIQAPEDQAAQTEQPVPDAPAEAAAPEPVPAPPAPKPAPAAAVAAKAPAKPVAKPQKTAGLDLDALEATIAKAAKASGGKSSSAAKGPSRPETAKVARPDLGEGLAANALKGLADELQRRWNPNCEVEGGRSVKVRVTFTLGAGGHVMGGVTAGGQERSSNAVEQAAAERAIRAVYQAAPFKNLPRDFYGDRIAVNFNAAEACS